MSSGTLINLNHSSLSAHGFGAQLNMLDCKMSSTLSPTAPVNMLSEACFMWENDMAHPPPSKLESTDIMDLIDQAPAGGNGNEGNCDGGGENVEPGSTSPTTIIHHIGQVNRHPSHHDGTSSSYGASITSPPSSTSNSISSPSSSSSSTTSQYLAPLPSIGDHYVTATDCSLLDGFHGTMDSPFQKIEQSHAFQDGAYDAFMSDLSHPPPLPPTISNGQQAHNHNHNQPQSHIHGNGTGVTPCHDNSNGVLLLDMSNHHAHHIQQTHGGQCSPGCVCGGAGHSYPIVGDASTALDICHHQTTTGLAPPHHPHHNSHHHHPHHHHHTHQQDYSSSWDDLHSGDYSILFRKGESPSTSDCISYTDNDSESKSSGGSLSGINEITHVSPPKRKVGRPPKKDKKLKRNEKKTGRLWEFIRDLLKNPEYCPSLVKWENHEEGHFRFVNSEKVAQLWGQIKGNPRMTYEKLSRAMRYYYKSHVFEPVLGRRLVYKFGYNATNWKPINPNFVSSHHKMYN